MAVRAAHHRHRELSRGPGRRHRQEPCREHCRPALDFKDWLVEKWQAEGRAESDTQLIFCSEPVQPGGTGATSKDIRQRAAASSRTTVRAPPRSSMSSSAATVSRSVEQPGSRADIVITSDFEDARPVGDACLNLDAMIAWLRDHLGPGRHYYFVDACRNKLNASQIQIGSLLPIDPQASGEASTYVLQSTVDGDIAAADGAFPQRYWRACRSVANPGRCPAANRSQRVAGSVHVSSCSPRSKEPQLPWAARSPPRSWPGCAARAKPRHGTRPVNDAMFACARFLARLSRCGLGPRSSMWRTTSWVSAKNPVRLAPRTVA